MSRRGSRARARRGAAAAPGRAAAADAGRQHAATAARPRGVPACGATGRCEDGAHGWARLQPWLRKPGAPHRCAAPHVGSAARGGGEVALRAECAGRAGRRPRARHGPPAHRGREQRCASLSSSAVSSDRVAAVRSVDFAAEEGVVAPPGGAPGTPAGYCWLLHVSFRRMARSGWTCDLGDGHDEAYETRKDLVAVATFPPFPFLFSCWCRRTTA